MIKTLGTSVLIAGLLVSAGCAMNQDKSMARRTPFPVDRKDFRIGLGVGELSEALFEQGFTYTDGEMEATTMEELQELLSKHGGTEVWARINTRRAKVTGQFDYSLNAGLRRARIAAKLGLYFNPELGLFGEYGDIRGQDAPDFSEYPEIQLPGPWETLTIDQMEPAIEQYAELTAREILATGAKVNFWKIGNEVNFGIAGVAIPPMSGFQMNGMDDWYRAPDNVNPEIGKMTLLDFVKLPDGEGIPWLAENVWPYEARLLAAAARGIRKVDPGAKFSTHTSFLPPEAAVAFFQAMQNGGFHFDQIDISFYPGNGSDRIDTFKETVKALTSTFGMPVNLVEYAYAAELWQEEGFFSNWTHDYPNYPISEEGQANLLRDVTSWGWANGLSGIRAYGADGVIPIWEPNALFNIEGDSRKAVARKGLDAIVEGLALTEPATLEE